MSGEKLPPSTTELRDEIAALKQSLAAAEARGTASEKKLDEMHARLEGLQAELAKRGQKPAAAPAKDDDQVEEDLDEDDITGGWL